MKKLTNLFTVIISLIMISCSENHEPKNPDFIQNAGILENGQTVSPGSIVHLEGNGYKESDDVILNFFWETGETIIPEGYIKGYKAKVISKSADGRTIQMPYRKPASRVEINLMRNGDVMTIGNVNITDGLTPSELNLYGIYNATKIQTSLDKQIIRWVDENYNQGDMKSWSLAEHPDFHSAIGAYRLYGICGLSKENGNQYPFFFDLCTQQWNKLSDISTIALFGNGSTIGAIQSRDGKMYVATDITINLDRSENYLTSRSQPLMSFPLPDGVDADQLSDFPGAYTPDGVLLAANKGNGKWIPVFFNYHRGFATFDEIEAARIIPFAIRPFDKENQNWTAGYIVVKEEFENGNSSFLYTIGENRSLSQEPIAKFPNKALSATVNYNQPDKLTIHFESHRDEGNGNVTMEYSFKKQNWTPINAGGSFDEIVWIN